ncbi:hypothetical protein QZH41_017837, partial [Actinostola sp. cb2023]
MIKYSPDGEDQVSTPHFRSVCNTTTNPNTLEEDYNNAVEKIKSSFLEFQREGSGWQLSQEWLCTPPGESQLRPPPEKDQEQEGSVKHPERRPKMFLVECPGNKTPRGPTRPPTSCQPLHQEGLRGGISMITHRHAKANNTYVQDYNPEQPHNYLMYLDANNLYGWAMFQSLPVNNFGWLSPGEVEELQENLMTLPDDGTEGYILEVDLEYPKELHDLHNDYPLASERQKVPQDWLSPYCHQVIEDLELNFTPTEKLVPNLNGKTHYILHYRNLQQYLSLGMKLTKVHRVLGFDQSPWLKTYIDFNTEKRKQARNDFEKDFFKLMNNSVFGKTMENLRRRVSVRLVNTPKQLKKLTANPLFDYFRIFDENLVGVNMKKPTLYLNRPIYVGFCILDLSKTLMYDFHYNVIKQKYGNQATLLFTDTDSLCYNIQTEDIYEDMQQDLDLYDTSEYPRDHPLYSTVNKKVLGKMKDEIHGLPIEEFVGLSPKMYSLLFTENNKPIEKKTAKGVAKHVTKHRIRHAHYRDCLFEKKRTMANMKQLRSYNHQIYTVNLNKIGLSPYDDKRFILDDGVTTLAHGHELIHCIQQSYKTKGHKLRLYRYEGICTGCTGAPVFQNSYFPSTK